METCGTQRGGSLAEHSAPKTQRIEWEQADIPGPKVAAGANWAQKLEEGVCRLKPCLNGGWEPGQGDTGLDSLSSSALRLMPLIQQGDQPSSPQSLSSSQPGSDLVTSDQGVFLRWERWDSSWWSRECQEGAQGQDGFSLPHAVLQPCSSTQQTPPATRAHPCPPQDTKQPEPARGEQQSREVTGDGGTQGGQDAGLATDTGIVSSDTCGMRSVRKHQTLNITRDWGLLPSPGLGSLGGVTPCPLGSWR